MSFGTLGIGDVLAVDVSGIAADLIRIGAAIEGRAVPASHVVIVDHQDKKGRWWGIQGEPGGVGWIDIAQVWGSGLARYGNSNELQKRTPAQRQAVADLCHGLLHTGYDWIGGIVADGFDDVHLAGVAEMLDRWWGWGTGPAPGHVVCSSLAAWAHDQMHLNRPHGTLSAELVQPADWWQFNAGLGG